MGRLYYKRPDKVWEPLTGIGSRQSACCLSAVGFVILLLHPLRLRVIFVFNCRFGCVGFCGTGRLVRYTIPLMMTVWMNRFVERRKQGNKQHGKNSDTTNTAAFEADSDVLIVNRRRRIWLNRFCESQWTTNSSNRTTYKGKSCMSRKQPHTAQMVLSQAIRFFCGSYLRIAQKDDTVT